MKLTNKAKTSIRVIVMFTLAIASTFIPEMLPSIFNDIPCEGVSQGCEIRDVMNGHRHAATLHWGYRHYLYFFMCCILMAIQASSVIENYEKG